MDSDSDRTESFHSAHNHYSPRCSQRHERLPSREKSEIFLQIKHLLRQFSTIKREILDLKAHVGKQDETNRYLRNKVVPRTPRMKQLTSSRKMNFTLLCEICKKIMETGSLDGLTIAELQFLQESAYVAGIRQSTTEIELIEPSIDFDECVRRIEYLHSKLNTARENIRAIRRDLEV